MSGTLLIICGPTATGKTKLAVALAKKFAGELVSADSRQVYRGMDIGTGKDASETVGVPLWMIDVVNPNEDFSVSHYAAQATGVIQDIRKRGKLPIVVGGSGFYISALIRPPETLDVPPNRLLRSELAGARIEVLQARLQALDKNVFGRMNASDKMNPRRLIRKIEIASSTKKKTPPSLKKHFEHVLSIGLMADPVELYRRIDKRVDARISQGVTHEIGGLLDRGYSWDLPAMNTLGYKEWKDFFTHGTPTEVVTQKWKYHEHAYARRQMTWFRKMPSIQWFDITDPELLAKVTRKVTAWYT